VTTDAVAAGPEPAQTTSRWELDDLLANRRWVRRSEPFPHVVAQDVFEPKFYAQLEQDFLRVEREHPEVFQRNMRGYDATSANVGEHAAGPLGIFVSRAWHDLIAGVAGVSATGDVHASLHHHDPGSASGWPHNDLNPGWFEGPAPGPDDVCLTSLPRVDYAKGPREAGTEARETIRAVSVLFYLANPPWQPGDGGETGLFTSSAAAAGPAQAVAPINNSLVLFECTPFSWHAFVSNRTKPRNSVVMWLHRPKDEVVQRWGEHSIVYW
jgi:2-oxoglutarate-Fe(II)-dependent oxygenase superfamily protein